MWVPSMTIWYAGTERIASNKTIPKGALHVTAVGRTTVGITRNPDMLSRSCEPFYGNRLRDLPAPARVLRKARLR